MDLALPVSDDGMLAAREVDHLFLAGDEEFVANLVGLVAFGVGFDDLDVDAGDLVEFDGAEFALSTLGDKGLGGLGEDHAGAGDVALVAVFIEEDAVFEALEGDGIADIAVVGIGDHFDSGGRDVEADIGAFDDDVFAHGKLFFGEDLFGFVGGFDDGLSEVFLGGDLVVDADHQVLVGLEVVAFDDFAHLAGPEGEGDGAGDVDLVSDQQFCEVADGAGFGRLVVGGWIFDDDIPSFGRRGEEML